MGSTTSMVLDQIVWRPLTIAWSFVVGAVLTDGSLVVRLPIIRCFKVVANGSLVFYTYCPSESRVLFLPTLPAQQNLRANLKKDYKKAFRNGLVLWVPLQYINFRYVPMRWRVLFIDIVHFFWCVPSFSSTAFHRTGYFMRCDPRVCRDIYLCVMTMESKSAEKTLQDDAAQKEK